MGLQPETAKRHGNSWGERLSRFRGMPAGCKVWSQSMQDSVSQEHHIERLRFRRAPLAAAAAWFAAGILLARYTPHAPIQLVVSILILSAGAVLLMESWLAWIPVAALWMALGVCAAEWQPMPANQAALLANADNLSRTVRARVTRIHASPPARETRNVDSAPPWEAAEDTSQQHGQPLILDLVTEQVEAVTPDLSTMIPVLGGIRVSVFPSHKAGSEQNHFVPFCGEEIEVPLRLKPPDRFRTPGAFDYAGLLLGQGIAVRSNVSEDLVHPVGASAPGFRCRIYASRA